MNLGHLLTDPVFTRVGATANRLGRQCFVVGGYVRDLMLHRHSKDIDFVTVGSGIELAEAVGARLGRGTHLVVYRSYGTAQLKRGDMELEFVGARRESYHRDSRNPVVEDGTLDDDLARRDFTINAMAYNDTEGLIDIFGGMEDLKEGRIRCVGDPKERFTEDGLRILRAVRFFCAAGL